MLERIKKNDVADILIPSVSMFCCDIIKDKTSILLNPALGGQLEGVESSIPSDADLVIDDVLYDIKCTKTYKPFSEITQLLGYASLIMLNNRYLRKINQIAIINMVSGNITTYNIDFVNKENCSNYVKVLTNIAV